MLFSKSPLVKNLYAVIFLFIGAYSLQAEQNSLLWKITTPTGKVHHIFGTIHLSDTTLFNVNKHALEKLNSSKVFVAEIDLSATPDINPFQMMLPDGKTLADIYSVQDFALIDSVLKEKMGAMAPMMLHIKPPFIAAMLMMEELKSVTETGNSVPLDLYLWQTAQKKSKQCKALETISEQLNAFSSMPDSLLILMLKDTTFSDSGALDLVQAYKKQDLTAISALIDSQSYLQEFMITINDNRNKVMLERLPEILKGPSSFTAIGAAHLPGKNGLLQGLRKLGYKVEPVK